MTVGVDEAWSTAKLAVFWRAPIPPKVLFKKQRLNPQKLFMEIARFFKCKLPSYSDGSYSDGSIEGNGLSWSRTASYVLRCTSNQACGANVGRRVRRMAVNLVRR